MSSQEIEESMELLAEVGEEIIADKGQLEWLLQNKDHIIAYDGFEPSGKIHIAQGLMRAINVNKIIKAITKHTNFTFKMFVADFHAAANNKFGGDLEIIQKVGKYFIEVWRASGMDLDHVEFLWASEIAEDPKYWESVLKISINTSLKRALRCTQIMGRSETDALQSSQILYPLMQCADIFYLKADICQLGLDQRKVNMLAREVAKNLGYKYKPVAMHHHMLMGLGKPPETDLEETDKKIARKMSKSDPNSAVFMLDTKADIKRKINKAWCPQGEVEENPILEYCKYIIMERVDKFEVNRPEKYGGNITFDSYFELESAYASGRLNPVDLKQTVIRYLDEMIQPVRDHFENDPEAKELAEFVEGLYNKKKSQGKSKKQKKKK